MPKKNGKKVDVWELTGSMQKMVAEHAKALLGQYRQIRGIFDGPNKILLDAVMEFWPQGTEKFFELFDMWLRDQMDIFEHNVDDSIKEYASRISALEFTSLGGDYRNLAKEHTDLWIANYKKLRERRTQVSQASLDALKEMLPAMVHPILDNANRWLVMQNEILERQLIARVKESLLELDAAGAEDDE